MKPLPPPNFNPAGIVRSAAILTDPPPFISAQRAKRVTGRKAQGKRYERKGHQHFAQLAKASGAQYLQGPWFRFESQTGGIRWCQPDALVLKAQDVTILEFKYQHTFDAWWQMFELYAPVVKFLFPTLRIAHCEVVKWYDPSTYCEPKAILAADPLRVSPDQFHVHIWRA